MKTDSYQTKRRNIILRKNNEKKSRRKTNRRAFRAISFFAERHTALLGNMVQSWKRDRTAARERERSERNERKEGVTCWKIS